MRQAEHNRRALLSHLAQEHPSAFRLYAELIEARARRRCMTEALDVMRERIDDLVAEIAGTDIEIAETEQQILDTEGGSNEDQ